MKQFTVTFNFDPETEIVSDIKTFVDGVEKKKTTTKKAKTKEVVLEEESIISVLENKLQFNNKVVAEMQINNESRVVIEYEKLKDNTMIPIIGTDLSFGREGDGNKLSKTNTVMFKGKQNTILKEFGTEFSIEPYKEGIWKLVSKNEGVKFLKPDTYEEAVEFANSFTTDLYTEDDDNTEIEEMTFTL